jgi:excisionase family DNA binding protein
MLETLKVGRVLRPREAAEKLGISLSTLKRLEADGELPARTQISQRRYGWPEVAIDQFILGRSAA